MKIGTSISQVATPIARVLGMPCVDQATGMLRPDSTCAKVRDSLDAGRWKEAAYDFIWRKKTNTEKGLDIMADNMKEVKDWIIIHQIGVQASNFKEAITKMEDGETLAITAQLRMQPPSTSAPVRMMQPMTSDQLAEAAQQAKERELATKSQK